MDGVYFLFFTWRLTEEVKNKINLLNTNIRDVVNSHKQTCENIRFNIDTLHKQFYRL